MQNQNTTLLSNIIGLDNEHETKVKTKVVTPQMVEEYVEVSGDRNPIHTSDEAAKKAGFPHGKIAHGTLISGLTFSAIVDFFGHYLKIEQVAIHFIRPVYVGAQVEIHLTKKTEETTNTHYINFEVKSMINNRLKTSAKGHVTGNASQENCDRGTLDKTLMVAWIAKATTENLNGIAVTHLSINYTNEGLKDKKEPSLQKEHEPINTKNGTRRTHYKGTYDNTEIYNGYYDLYYSEWKEAQGVKS